MKKSTFEINTQLGQAMLSQGYGPEFSPRLEKRIQKLKDMLRKSTIETLSDKGMEVTKFQGVRSDETKKYAPDICL
jgi:hypothetical protein